MRVLAPRWRRACLTFVFGMSAKGRFSRAFIDRMICTRGSYPCQVTSYHEGLISAPRVALVTDHAVTRGPLVSTLRPQSIFIAGKTGQRNFNVLRRGGVGGIQRMNTVN